ncbi:MAG TPA: hypothetical protein ENI29_14930 [bacterium]|nr:hypothetical protein [bacterium]
MKQVFVSFHYTAKDKSVNGFGNYVGEFNPDDYLNDLRNFILDLEEKITKVFEDQTKIPCAIKVMFWR